MRMCHFWTQNGPFVLNKFFLVLTIIITFSYLLAPFIVQNLKKLLQWILSYEDAPVLGPKWSICPQFFFFFGGGIINTILIYLLATSIVHNLKKILPVDQELWGYTIFRPKMTHFPNWEWKKKTVNEPNIKVRYYSITEILTIKEYWNLIGREPLLAITWEPDFSQACCFHRMLMNHNNVYLTQISDKTNDVIFLKSSKNFLGHFWPFLPDEDLFQKIRLCHIQLSMGP